MLGIDLSAILRGHDVGANVEVVRRVFEASERSFEAYLEEPALAGG